MAKVNLSLVSKEHYSVDKQKLMFCLNA